MKPSRFLSKVLLIFGSMVSYNDERSPEEGVGITDDDLALASFMVPSSIMSSIDLLRACDRFSVWSLSCSSKRPVTSFLADVVSTGYMVARIDRLPA